MAKFELGEIALYVGKGIYLNTKLAGQASPITTGSEIQILRIDLSCPYRFLYAIGKDADMGLIWTKEENLRKRRPPEQPADDQDFIDWFNKTIKQEPLTESAMKRTLANLGAYMETK